MDSRDKKTHLELLSPAGSRESLIAAVQNGADAVYMGGGNFNARRNAKNFSEDELFEAIDYCHINKRKCYITVNTLYFDRELKSVLDFARKLYEQGADALIVQDLGLVYELRRLMPGLELHASTQFAVHNEYGLETIKKLGLTRAVLSRETSISELRRLSGLNTGVELEVFGHGALCMSFSGECLYSSMAGERSGNRGLCAQPCRKKARLISGGGERVLSPTDICMIDHLAELAEAGACCIKLEGRMKRAEYVAAVTRAYRDAIDTGKVDKGLVRDMVDIFSRGFTTGFGFGDDVRTDAVSPDAPGEELTKRLALTYADTKTTKIPAKLTLTVETDEPSELVMSAQGKSVTVCGAMGLHAQRPQNEETYIRQLNKLGGTLFEACETSVKLVGDAYLSAADINALRRQACEGLKSILLRKRTFDGAIDRCASVKTKCTATELITVVRNAEQAEAAKRAGADTIALDPISYDDIKCSEEELGDNALLWLPVELFGNREADTVKGLLKSGVFAGVIANNIGHMSLASGLRIIAGPHMNCTNDACASALIELGAENIVLSPELTRPQVRDICRDCGCGVSVYCRQPLMHLTHCPIKERKGCQGCDGLADYIEDGEGRRFPFINTIIGGRCYQRMLNMTPTYIIDKAKELGASVWLMQFSIESPNTVGETIESAVRALRGQTVNNLPHDYTRGHYNRQVD